MDMDVRVDVDADVDVDRNKDVAVYDVHCFLLRPQGFRHPKLSPHMRRYRGRGRSLNCRDIHRKLLR